MLWMKERKKERKKEGLLVTGIDFSFWGGEAQRSELFAQMFLTPKNYKFL